MKPHSSALSAAILVAAASLALTACGSGTGGASGDASSSSPSGTIDVVAATNVWGDVVRQIGGDHVAITSFISNPDADPHSYEASTRNQLLLSKAQVVVENGGGYDDFMGKMLESAKNTRATVIDAVDVSGKKASAGGELNEHVWYDFDTVKKVTDAVSDALAKAQPANRSTFEANAAAFAQKVDALQATEASIKSAHAGQGVGITEPVPLYLLEASGLVNKTPADFSAAVEEGDDAPVAVLNETLGLYSGHRVVLLAYNEQAADPQAQKVIDAAKAAGIPAVGFTETLPRGEDYISWMTKNLDALKGALNR